MRKGLPGLIYLSPLPWSSFEQRPHKFVRWFHHRAHGVVLWVDPYPTRFPNVADFQRFLVKPNEGAADVPPWLTVVTPKAMPIEPVPGSGLVNRLLWGGVLRQIRNFSSAHEVLVAIGKPSVLADQVLSMLPGVTSLYDSMDDFPSFYSGFSSMAMEARERKLVKRVTTLAVSSTALLNRWLPLRTDVKLVPNGLDHGAVSVVRHGGRKRSTPSRFGYVGTIGEWFDWDWVVELASIRPSDQIMIVGPVFKSLSGGVPKNVTMRPACTHAEALASMASFDVGLIPFRSNRLTSSVDPIKYYEYKALGVPVLSTAFGEMIYRTNEPGTFISKNVDDIEGLASKALDWTAERTDIDGFIRRSAWHARFDTLGLF